jgi:hypothetical protein
MHLKNQLKIDKSIKCFLIKTPFLFSFIIFEDHSKNISCVKIPHNIYLSFSKDLNLVLNSKNDISLCLNFLGQRLNSLKFPYFVKLFLKGLGFRMKVQTSVDNFLYLELKLGFSHLNVIKVPSTLKLFLKKNSIVVSGFSRNLVGNFTRLIYNLRYPNCYTGKGFRYKKQILYLKNIKKT